MHVLPSIRPKFVAKIDTVVDDLGLCWCGTRLVAGGSGTTLAEAEGEYPSLWFVKLMTLPSGLERIVVVAHAAPS